MTKRHGPFLRQMSVRALITVLHMYVCMYLCMFYYGHAPYGLQYYNPMTGADRPPSLPVVATFSIKSLRLPLKIIRKHVFHTSTIPRLCCPSPCRFKYGETHSSSPALNRVILSENF
jgi:hypothetical protein